MNFYFIPFLGGDLSKSTCGIYTFQLGLGIFSCYSERERDVRVYHGLIHETFRDRLAILSKIWP